MRGTLRPLKTAFQWGHSERESKAYAGYIDGFNKTRAQWEDISVSSFSRLPSLQILVDPRRHFSAFGDGPDDE